MKEQTKTVFTCDFCKKRLFVKNAMVNHEFNCTYNPKNFSQCSTCENLEKTKVEYSQEAYFDGHFYDEVKETNGFHCTARDVGLYPYKCVRKGLVERYPETFEGKELMPASGCNEFKDTNELQF